MRLSKKDLGAPSARSPKEYAAKVWPWPCRCKGNEHDAICGDYIRSGLARAVRAGIEESAQLVEDVSASSLPEVVVALLGTVAKQIRALAEEP